MSTRVAVMNTAEVHQVGTPAEVYERPSTRFVATFLGRNNIFDGVVTTVDSDLVHVRLPDGTSLTGSPTRTSPGLPLTPGSAVGASIRAEAIHVASEGDSQNVVSGTVTDVEFVGATLSCALETPIGALLLDLTGAGIRPSRGDRLSVLLSSASIYFVPVEPVT